MLERFNLHEDCLPKRSRRGLGTFSSSHPYSQDLLTVYTLSVTEAGRL